MKRIGRIRESVVSLSIVILCLLGILVVTIATPLIEARYELENEKVEQGVVENSQDEQLIEVNTKALFEYKGISINEEERLRQLINVLPGENEIEQVIMPNSTEKFGIQIQYKFMQNNSTVNKSKMEQLMLLDSTILISLCSDLNAVTMRVSIGEDLVERFVYKTDLDNYFEEDIRSSWLLEDFKKYSEVFLSQEAVTQYASQKYTYSTILGEAVDRFFKSNFPVGQLAADSQMPYMDEELGEALLKDYGYRLFIEGLKYDNDYVNYYSVYRLLEFYDTSELEEVLVELAICKNRTSNEQVKLACTYVMGILGNRSIENPLWVTRFMENTFGGGRKVYVIWQGKIKQWCEWEIPTRIKAFSISPDGEMVWCYGMTPEQEYAYVLPLESEICYSLGNIKVEGEDGENHPEIVDGAKEWLSRKQLVTYIKPDSNLEVTINWFNEAFLKLDIISKNTKAEYTFFYNPEIQELSPAASDEADFSLAELMYDLKDTLPLKGHTHITHKEAEVEATRLYLGQDYVTIYEYNSIEERQEKKQSLRLSKMGTNTTRINKKIYFFEKGKLLVMYEGDEENIIDCLTEELNPIIIGT